MRLSYQACRSAGVECIVAPYEADAQLAYLSKEGVVDLIITEDSDLLVFGCRKVRMVSRHMNPHTSILWCRVTLCLQVLFKLDDSGNGKLIETDQLGKANRGLVVRCEHKEPQITLYRGAVPLTVYI